jgi:hypothetical protein
VKQRQAPQEEAMSNPAPPDEPNAEPLMLVFIPPLGNLLLNLERSKGSLLTREEVLQARDKAVCMRMRSSMKAAMDKQRGWRDIDPDRVWQEWQQFRAKIPRE